MDGVLETVVKRIGDQGVPNGYLLYPGYLLPEEAQVLQVQIVTGINFQSGLPGHFCRCHKGSDCSFRILKLKKTAITEDTTRAFDTIRELVAELSSRYMEANN